MRILDKKTLMPEMIKIKNMKLKQFGIAQSTQRSQQAIYQGFIIWFYRKVTLKKKTPKSLTQWFNTPENL